MKLIIVQCRYILTNYHGLHDAALGLILKIIYEMVLYPTVKFYGILGYYYDLLRPYLLLVWQLSLSTGPKTMSSEFKSIPAPTNDQAVRNIFYKNERAWIKSCRTS